MKRTIQINKGDKYGYLIVIKEDKPFDYKRAALCKCICGNIKRIRIESLRSGYVTHCGCKKKTDHTKTHGLSKHKLYKTWAGIKHRCSNPNNKSYKYYGGKGIKNTRENIEAFLNDMEDSYIEGYQIDRIDNNGDYCKDNCRWVTPKTQARNRSSNLIYKGKTLIEWCEQYGLIYSTINARVNYGGYTLEEAILKSISQDKTIK